MNSRNCISHPRSKWKFFYLICVGKLPIKIHWDKPSYRYKFFLKTVFLSPLTLKWLNKLRMYPLMWDYLLCQTHLCHKLQRPYLSSKMNQKAKFDALVYHYQFLSYQPNQLTKAFYNPSMPFILSDLTVKNESKIKIAIQSQDKNSREGEICIYLYFNNEVVAVLTFSIVEYQKKSTLFIGGLQGPNIGGARLQIQKATKDCYGLFPKRIVIEVAVALVNYLKLEQIIAVGNQSHIYSYWLYKKRFKRMHSDYNDFWLSIGATQNQEELFLLPTAISKKAIEDIASKKRSEYRNRYALLDLLNQEIKAALLSLTDITKN